MNKERLKKKEPNPNRALLRPLIELINKLRCEIPSKADLRAMEKRIMSKISDWAANVAPKLDNIQTGVDALQDLVTQLQSSPGTLTPEDQAILDQIETKVNSLASDAGNIPSPPAPPT